MESEEGNEKTRKRMASVIASIAAVCVMTGGIGYQAAVSGAQTDSTENSVKAQNTDQQESTDGSFRKKVPRRSARSARCRNLR